MWNVPATNENHDLGNELRFSDATVFSSCTVEGFQENPKHKKASVQCEGMFAGVLGKDLQDEHLQMPAANQLNRSNISILQSVIERLLVL